MQFTGQSDQCKRDIYEGDIVQLKCSTNKSRYCMGKIDFCIHGFEVHPFVRAAEHLYAGAHDCWRYMEVIGNVYENPELVAKPDEHSGN